jgi:D-alanine-D-alanine ligase
MKIIAVVSGGFTGEKVISEKSAAMVMDNIDRSIFKPYLVWIDKKEWNVRIGEQKIPINRHDFSFEWGGKAVFFDAVFMAIHGDPGENGRLQAYFEMLDLPVTTGGFFTMALTFNKFATTSMLKKASFFGRTGYFATKRPTVFTKGNP